MNKKTITFYEPPRIEMLEFELESGFAGSQIGGVTDDEEMGGGGEFYPF